MVTRLTVVFDDIYRRNVWNGVETRSGPGSGRAATHMLARALPALVESYGWQTVLDLGCGEGSWQPDLPGYIGMDVSRRAIKEAQIRHPDRVYLVGEYSGQRADLVIIRDVLQHLPLEMAADLVHRVRRESGGALLASTYEALEQPPAIEAGDCSEWSLTLPPFALGEPVLRIEDGYRYDVPGIIRDATKYLGLWV